MIKSLKKLSSFRFLYESSRFYNHTSHAKESADSNDLAETHQYQVRQFYKDFSKKAITQGNEYKLLKQTINNLRGCKLGISLADPVFIPFIRDFNSCFKRITRLDYLLDIMREMMLFEFRSEIFWRESFDFLWSLKPELLKSDTSIIGFFFILMQGPYKDSFVQRQPGSIQELQKLLLGLRSSLNTAKLPLEALVEFLSLNIELGLDNQVFMKLFQEKLMPQYKELLKKSSTYFLSNLSLILHRTFFDPYPKKDPAGPLYKLINELNETVIYNDLSNYDTDLQNYEFSDSKPEEIGFKDFLSFQTLNNLLLIEKDSRFFNEDLVQRVEDAVIRKSETDLADIKNAGHLIYHLSRFQNSGTQALIRLMEMVICLFDEEGSHMGMYLTKNNMMKLIDGIGMIAYQKNIEAEPLIEVLERVADKISAGEVRLGEKFEKEDWEFMKKVYGLHRFAGRFNGFLNFLNNKNV